MRFVIDGEDLRKINENQLERRCYCSTVHRTYNWKSFANQIVDFIKIVKFRFVIKMTSFDILLIISNFNLVGGGAIEERFIFVYHFHHLRVSIKQSEENNIGCCGKKWKISLKLYDFFLGEDVRGLRFLSTKEPLIYYHLLS